MPEACCQKFRLHSPKHHEPQSWHFPWVWLAMIMASSDYHWAGSAFVTVYFHFRFLPVVLHYTSENWGICSRDDTPIVENGNLHTGCGATLIRTKTFVIGEFPHTSIYENVNAMVNIAHNFVPRWNLLNIESVPESLQGRLSYDDINKSL